MAVFRSPDRPSRILPPAIEAAIGRLPWRVAGLALLFVAAAGWLSLLTWSIQDPSLNHATDGVPHNALGPLGATLADLLLQSVGLAAIVFFLPIAVWGRQVMLGDTPDNLRLRLLLWPLAIMLLASALSTIPAPASWLLTNGLGGMIGDVGRGVFVRIGAFLEPMLAGLIGGTIAAAAGLWALMRACGWQFRDLGLLIRPGAADPAPAPAMTAGWLTALPGTLSRHGRDWRARLVQQFRRGRRRQGERTAGPREYWMYREPEAADLPEDDGFTPAGDDEDAAFEGIEAGFDGRIEPHFGPLLPGYDSDAGPPARAVSPASPAPPRVAATFTLPPLRLLNAPPVRRRGAELSDEALWQSAEMLEGVLRDFGVKGQIMEVHPGPVITLYEFQPARGTKSSRVIGLADDIARSMSAVSARVAVIPGRDAIGIELPNEDRETVYLRALLESLDYRSSKASLPLALGKTIGGDPVIADLSRMPHLLIAGTTGSGKSVGINTMILSLLYRLPPDACRFIMIDPKMLELSIYDGIPHLLTPVVTDPKKAIVALKWSVNEMNVRYEKMCKLGVRNIQNYNQKLLKARLNGEALVRRVNTGFDQRTGSAIYEHEDMDGEPMPYIVIVIDEMADLMMVAGKDIEYAVQRLSQMARAAGIHLIMATQRPSVDVITGTIKANFPSRASFQVTSKIDSRTILGEQGAEQLLGAGDMLHMAAGGRIIRAHGPFVSDEEVEKVVAFLKAQGSPDYLDDVVAPKDDEGDGEGERPGKSGSDELYDQAVDIVLTDRRATTSYLQRRLGIGYNKAASLIERMEEDGILGPPNRTGKRDILVGGDD